ncbi:MAG: hypothetical protein HYX99_04165, partial [Chloroflexi bacterium]|nr:hypothetical protein [Chloroflexota bacterium]
INPRVTLALLEKLLQLMPLPIDLGELRAAASLFQEGVDKALAQEPRLVQYVAQLEEALDAGRHPAPEMPSPEELMRDLDDFLRRRQGR